MSARVRLVASQPGLAVSQLNLWRELACFALIFMQLSWISPWYVLLVAPTTGATPLRVISGLFLILTGAYLETRLAEALRLVIRMRLVFFLVYFLMSVLFGLKFLFYFQEPFGLWGSFIHLIQVIRTIDIWIPREFTGIFAFFLVNLSGVSLALEPTEPYRVFRSFTIGIGMFLLMGLIYINLPAWISTGMLALFLVSALLGMCSARFALLGRLRGSQRIPFDRQRLAEVSLFVSALTGLSLLAAALARAPAPFQFLFGFAEIAFRALLLIVALIMSPFYLLMILLFPKLQPSPVIANFLNRINQILSQLRELLAALTSGLPKINFYWFLSLKPLIQVTLLFLAALVIFLWVRSLYLRKRKDTTPGLVDSLLEESFSALQRPGWRNPFLFLMDRLGERLGGKSRGRKLAAEQIRQIYAELCNQAAQLGRSREVSQTPLEYLSILEKLFPGRRDDLEAITRAYLSVRYGEIPETHAQVEAVLSAWERLSDEINNQLEAQKKGKKAGLA